MYRPANPLEAFSVVVFAFKYSPESFGWIGTCDHGLICWRAHKWYMKRKCRIWVEGCGRWSDKPWSTKFFYIRLVYIKFGYVSKGIFRYALINMQPPFCAPSPHAISAKMHYMNSFGAMSYSENIMVGRSVCKNTCLSFFSTLSCNKINWVHSPVTDWKDILNIASLINTVPNSEIYLWCNFTAISVDGTFQKYLVTTQGHCKQKISAFTLDMGDDFTSWWSCI